MVISKSTMGKFLLHFDHLFDAYPTFFDWVFWLLGEIIIYIFPWERAPHILMTHEPYFMHLLWVVHSWELLFISCWDASPWRTTRPFWRIYSMFLFPTLRIWLWIYPLGGLWRLDVAPLIHLIPYLMGMSHSLGNMFFGDMFLWPWPLHYFMYCWLINWREYLFTPP